MVGPCPPHLPAFRQICRPAVYPKNDIARNMGKLPFYPASIIPKLIEHGGSYRLEAMRAHFIIFKVKPADCSKQGAYAHASFFRLVVGERHTHLRRNTPATSSRWRMTRLFFKFSLFFTPDKFLLSHIGFTEKGKRSVLSIIFTSNAMIKLSLFHRAIVISLRRRVVQFHSTLFFI